MTVIGIINQLSAVYASNFADKAAPVLLLLLRSQHLTSDAEHLTACLLGQLCIICDERGIRLKPFVPVLIAPPLVAVGEGDPCAPDPIAGIEYGL